MSKLSIVLVFGFLRDIPLFQKDGFVNDGSLYNYWNVVKRIHFFMKDFKLVII